MQMQGIIDCVAELWPGTKIVHGKARHSQSQGGVEQVSMEGVLHYRVGAKPGVLKGVYARHQLKPLFDTPPSILGLHEILTTWEDAPRVGERRCMRVVSHTGGQGFLKCSCTGSCTTKRCACFKNKRICNSRCHKGNTRCANCHKDRD